MLLGRQEPSGIVLGVLWGGCFEQFLKPWTRRHQPLEVVLGVSQGCLGTLLGVWRRFQRRGTTAHPWQTCRTMGPPAPSELPPGAFLGRLGALLGNLSVLLCRQGPLGTVLGVLWGLFRDIIGPLGGPSKTPGGRLGRLLGLYRGCDAVKCTDTT